MVVDEVNKSIKERLRLVKVVGRYMLSLMEQEKHKIDREGVQALVLCCGTLGIAPALLSVSWLYNVGFGSGDECPWAPLMFQPWVNPEL